MENKVIKSYTNEELNEAEDAGKGIASDYYVVYASILLITLLGTYALVPQARSAFLLSFDKIVMAFAGLSAFGIFTSLCSYITLKSEKYKEKAIKRAGIYFAMTICIFLLGMVIWPAMWNYYISLQ